jgi:hypothetical protein
MELTQNLIKELFFYEDGKLFSKTTRGGRRIGEEAGTLGADGYIKMMIKRKMYKAHRLIYIYHKGEIADKLQIDHIDRNRSNNNIENLRLVTNQENHFNRGAKGFCFNKTRNKFEPQIRHNGKLFFLGRFDTAEEARTAYLKAKSELHIIEERI